MGFILEEGLEIALLKQVLDSVRTQLEIGALKLLSLDTKVVPKGCVDKLFINTTALGRVIYPHISARHLKVGQSIIVSDCIGTHGALLFSLRHEIQLHTSLQSDCKQLFSVLEGVLKSPYQLYAIRDATRGGLAALLNEWALASRVGIEIEEAQIPILEGVGGVCEILGLEPYALANEGVCVLSVASKDALGVCDLLRQGGANPAIIGEVIQARTPCVYLRNAWGSRRYLEMPEGELLPRIC